jgi:NodT family efflux transporter outer membrane factor (OMF) lipoprotein
MNPKLLAAVGAVALLAGCASTGTLRPPATLIKPDALGLQAGAAAFPRSDWWTRYRDPQLDALETQALAGNPDLQAAAARVREAAAGTAAAHAALLPSLGAQVSTTRELFSANDIYGPYGGSVFGVNQAMLQGSWSLDLFGRDHAALAAAVGRARAAEAGAQAARVVLAAQVAQTYFALARLDAQRTLLRDTLQQRRRIVELVHERVSAGLQPQLQLRPLQVEIPQIELELERNAQAADELRHALAALLGAGPARTAGLSPTLQALPGPAPAAELPAALLGRRADVVAARWQVRAALAGVREARAAFYPNINLAAFVGLDSISYASFLRAGSQTWGVGPALTLPIFEGGALRANLHGAQAGADAAIDRYNATVIGAVREVADALTRRASVERQQAQQRDALRLARDAMRLARQRYDAGLGNELGVLDAQGAVLKLQLTGVDLKAQALIDDVALTQALGGGYEPADREHVAQP